MNPKLLSLIALCLFVVAGSIVLFNRQNDDSSVPPETSADEKNDRVFDRGDESPSGRRQKSNRNSESGVKPTAMERAAMAERDQLNAQWVKQASVGFQQTRQKLVTDLGLSSAQAGELEEIFARRKEKLAGLCAKMNKDGTGDGRKLIAEICGVIRNKGLRDDLAEVLSDEQLATYEAREEKHERDTIEARAYRDLAEISNVIDLSDARKQDVLDVLAEQAPEKVEAEADTRAFMSLTYGPMAADMDSSYIQGMATMMNAEGVDPAMTYGSVEYLEWLGKRKAERIENELGPLRDVLDEGQLTRYREHLAKQPF